MVDTTQLNMSMPESREFPCLTALFLPRRRSLCCVRSALVLPVPRITVLRSPVDVGTVSSSDALVHWTIVGQMGISLGMDLGVEVSSFIHELG